MTVYEKIHKHLTDRGLWPKEAAAIIAEAQLSDALPAYFQGHHWDEECSAYPETVITALWLTLRRRVVPWLDEHAPQHFARAFFDDSPTN